MQDIIDEACEAVQAADIRVTAGGLLPATVRVVPDRSG
jgi:hypothetical protein